MDHTPSSVGQVFASAAHVLSMAVHIDNVDKIDNIDKMESIEKIENIVEIDNMDQTPSSAGQVLVKCWSSVGQLLVKCCSCVVNGWSYR